MSHAYQKNGPRNVFVFCHALSAGEVPRALRKHRNWWAFETGITADGAPVPPWKSPWSVAIPLSLGYLDLFTDVSTVISYYQEHWWWFALGLTFVVAPAMVAALFFLDQEEDMRTRLFVALHLGLLVEAFSSISREEYSRVLVSLRVVEPLYESVPQLMLQVYALLLEWDGDESQWLPFRLFSIVVSCSSLAYATTGLVAEHPLSTLSTSGTLSAWCPCLTGLAFGTVPENGEVKVYGSDKKLHSQDFVWAFLVYQVLEIGARFISLALLALVLRAYFFLVLVWLWSSRSVILRRSLDPRRESLGFRSQVRLVGMPFMDSVMDDLRSYDWGCALTTVEFLICMGIGVFVSTGGEVQVPADIRRVWCVAAAVCMVGKLLLGFLIVRPFKKGVGFGYGDVKDQEAPIATGSGSGDAEQGDGDQYKEEPNITFGGSGDAEQGDGDQKEPEEPAITGSSSGDAEQGDGDPSGIGGAVTDESDLEPQLEMTGISGGKVESRVAPSEGTHLQGTHLQPATHDLSAPATNSTSGEVEVEI